MNLLGGSRLILGLILILLGLLIQSSILEWLLNIVGFLVIMAGVTVVIYGLFKMFSNNRGGGV